MIAGNEKIKSKWIFSMKKDYQIFKGHHAIFYYWSQYLNENYYRNGDHEGEKAHLVLIKYIYSTQKFKIVL